MNEMKAEKTEPGRSPKSTSTVESYHDVAAAPEAYQEEERLARESRPAGGKRSALEEKGERLKRKAAQGPIPEMVRRERDFLVGTARERGRNLISAKMTTLAKVADDIAEVLHASAQRLKSEEDVTTAHYFDLTADGFGKAASTLGSPDFETMIHRTREFARTHPALFFGGMATAGFMVSRFLKASPEAAREPAVEFRPEAGPESQTAHLGIEKEEMRQSRPYGAVEKPEYA